MRDDGRLVALRKIAVKILRKHGIRAEDASKLRLVRLRMKNDEDYILLLETLFAYRQRVAFLESRAREGTFTGLEWARQVTFE